MKFPEMKLSSKVLDNLKVSKSFNKRSQNTGGYSWYLLRNQAADLVFVLAHSIIR